MAVTYDLDEEIAGLQVLKQRLLQVVSDELAAKMNVKRQLIIDAAKAYERLSRLQAELQGVLKPPVAVED